MTSRQKLKGEGRLYAINDISIKLNRAIGEFWKDRNYYRIHNIKFVDSVRQKQRMLNYLEDLTALISDLETQE